MHDKALAWWNRQSRFDAIWNGIRNQFVPGDESARRWPLRLFLIALALGQVMDVITTNQVLAAGGYEVNPVMSHLMEWFGVQWWLVKAVVAVFLIYLALKNRSVAQRWVALTGVFAIMQTLVILNNVMAHAGAVT
jgi:uncharacterized membrane protein YciS (DUF1049 family)